MNVLFCFHFHLIKTTRTAAFLLTSIIARSVNMEENVPQPESKRAKLEPIAPAPVSCGDVTESFEVDMIRWPVVSMILGRMYYSEPFPSNKDRCKFRLKLVYEGGWCMYITWIPSTSILMYNATISYIVEGFLTNGTKLGNRCIKNQRCNQWIALTCNGCGQSLSITHIKVNHNESAPTLKQPNPLCSMLDDDEDTIDTVELIGSDSAKVKVFQRVLQSHSEVFTRMLAGDWRENKDKCVNMRELNQEALQELKAYMYASKTPTKYARQLFVLANEYQMEHLKLCCAEQLYKQLTPENAMYILQLASTYEFEPLVTLVCSYWEEHRLLV